MRKDSSFEILDFMGLSDLCGGTSLAEETEGGRAVGVNCCNGPDTGDQDTSHP